LSAEFGVGALSKCPVWAGEFASPPLFGDAKAYAAYIAVPGSHCRTGTKTRFTGKIGYDTQSPIGRAMRFESTREASRLTSLSTAQLREWTNRRALIPADLPPKGRGSPAQYSWQTILLLRIAVTLRGRFHIELQAHQGLFKSLRAALRVKSFVALWNKTLILRGTSDWAIAAAAGPEFQEDDAVIIRLNPHLVVLAAGFSMSAPPAAAGQMNFFPALPVANSEVATNTLLKRVVRDETLRKKSA